MKTVLAALLVSLGLSAVAAPALAGPRGDRQDIVDVRAHDGERHGEDRRTRFEHVRRSDGVLSERRIARIVRRGGFAAIEDIRLRRDRYVVTAVRPNGAVFRLTLDSHDGDILGSERIGWSRGYDRRDYDHFRRSENRRPGGSEFRLGFGN